MKDWTGRENADMAESMGHLQTQHILIVQQPRVEQSRVCFCHVFTNGATSKNKALMAFSQSLKDLL